jgi:hypothetical protein
MSDILYEPISIPSVAKQLSHFDLTDEQLTALLQVSTLAGGAATNIFYNYIHNDAPKPMSPNSDLDFWVYDPHIDTLRHETRDRLYQLFNETLRVAGYTFYSEDINEARDVREPQNDYHDTPHLAGQPSFVEQGKLRIIYTWYSNEISKAGSRKCIQLIFTARPIEDTIMKFGFPICRAAVSCSPRGTFKLQWTGQCEKVIRDRVMMLGYAPYSNRKKDLRAKKYADRYGLTLLSPMGAPVTFPNSCDNEK